LSRIAAINKQGSTVDNYTASEGYDNNKIGSFLFLSEHTVRDYVSSLMTKQKAKNRTQVVASAFRLVLLN
jgi:DNA-binding NarL/FixJ family response regulator